MESNHASPGSRISTPVGSRHRIFLCAVAITRAEPCLRLRHRRRTAVAAAHPPILELPSELLLRIIEMLPERNRLGCGIVKKTFLEFVLSPSIQRSLFLEPEPASVAWSLPEHPTALVVSYSYPWKIQR